MALIRWEPARELTSIQRNIDRLFGSFFDSPTGTVYGGGARRWYPAVDLVEDGDHYVLRADLPGLSEDDVKVEVEDGILTVSGERRSESEESKGGYYRLERAAGSFARSLRLPEGVDASSIEARFDKGVLEVRVPKPEQPKPNRVSISVGQAPAAIEGEPKGQ
jgi:HSP20 family protein